MLLAVVKSEQPNSCCLSMSKLAASLNHSDVSPPEVSELRLRGKCGQRDKDLVISGCELGLQCTMSQDKC